jgi:hypothetical protein
MVIRRANYPTDADPMTTILHVDPDFAGIWREPPWYPDLCERIGRGERVWIVERGQHYELVQVGPEFQAAMQALAKLVDAEIAASLAPSAEAAEAKTPPAIS